MSLSYETAKKLKDAGFPQDSDSFFYGEEYIQCRDRLPEHKAYDPRFITAAPTLEELIEECGEKFLSLELDDDMTWRAVGCYRKGHSTTHYLYKNPSEAVAALWLAVNGER